MKRSSTTASTATAASGPARDPDQIALTRLEVRCEGGQPTCKTCEVYNDECRYDKSPPMSQVLAMAKRLREAQKTIEELRARGSSASSEDRYPSPRIDHSSQEDHEEHGDRIDSALSPQLAHSHPRAASRSIRRPWFLNRYSLVAPRQTSPPPSASA